MTLRRVVSPSLKCATTVMVAWLLSLVGAGSGAASVTRSRVWVRLSRRLVQPGLPRPPDACGYLVLAVFILLSSHAANAIQIDDFESGSFSVMAVDSFRCDFAATCFVTENGLSSAIGGQRSSSTLGDGSLVAFLNQGPENNAVQFSVSQAASSNPISASFFSMSYGFPTPLPLFDLTEGGTVDRFLVDVLSVSTVGSGIGALVQFGVGNVGIIFGGVEVAVSSPGTVALPFDEFFPSAGVDFTQVNRLDLTLTFRGVTDGTILVDNFRTGVPEPGTGVLLGLGLAMVASRRCGSRKSSTWSSAA